MPIPKLMGKVNKKVFNPMEIRRGKRPVLVHRGRVSGQEYQTPLDAHPVPDGYIFIMNYGAGSDWVQNILASGEALLRADGSEIELDGPRVIGPDEAWAQIAEGTKAPPKYLNITEYLRMDVAASVAGSGESNGSEDSGVAGTATEVS